MNTWIGLETVTELTRPHSVVVKLDKGSTKNLHVNKIHLSLKEWTIWAEFLNKSLISGICIMLRMQKTPVETILKFQGFLEGRKEDNIKIIVIEKHKSVSDIQKQELISTYENYQDFFSKKPGLARVDDHGIRFTALSILRRSYRRIQFG